MFLKRKEVEVFGFSKCGERLTMFCYDDKDFYIVLFDEKKRPRILQKVSKEKNPYFMESYGKWNAYVWLTSETEKLNEGWKYEDAMEIYDKWDEEYWNKEGAPCG